MNKQAKKASAQEITRTFRERFSSTPEVFRAPGRVNLIGEHTDYNDGFVMPVAIDLYTYAAIGPRKDRKLCVYSANFDEARVWNLDALPGGRSGHWSDYICGVTALLEAQHRLRGANLVVSSQVPIGSGLSSSAALEVAAALALLFCSGLRRERLEIAKLCQRAENEYTGTRCGIMDQFVSCFGRANHAVMLDCRDFSYQLLGIDRQMRIVVCNTKVKHELASGQYNLRRADCENSVHRLQEWLPQIKSLRDVRLGDLERYGRALSDQEFRRSRHVITENVRVQVAAHAAQLGDMKRFGELMWESHKSLRDDYEVSCRELDVLVEIAAGIEGVYGARMTGGGFGGCTVNLVRAETVSDFKAKVEKQYRAATGVTPEIYVFAGGNGAEKLEMARPGEPASYFQSRAKIH
ncbi:MAG TPA: galactokinase [Terriglobales bacterium]|nr:galactokinase [Terriglobales bacterium]